MSKLFIVLEGIDGSGTTTQANLLREYFLNRGEKAVISPEPTDGVIGRMIREIMQKPLISMPDSFLFDKQMAYLFAADRHYHLYNDKDGVFKLVKEENTHVISTRYYFSSLAYNCHTEEEYNFVMGLNKSFPPPDVLFYIDVSPEISLERIRDRKITEVYEKREKLVKVRENFNNILQNYHGKYKKLDGTLSIETIHREILTYLQLT